MWEAAAICVVSAATEAFEKKCAGLPKEEVDKLRAERAERIEAAFFTPNEPEKLSKWMMAKYYTAKTVLSLFRNWRTALLIVFVALVASTQYETVIEPENSVLYEVIK